MKAVLYLGRKAGSKVWTAVLIRKNHKNKHERWRGSGFPSKKAAENRGKTVAEKLGWEIVGSDWSLEV